MRPKKPETTGAAQGHHFPDRRQIVARRDQGAQPLGPEARGAAATILPAHRQTCRNDGGALRPRQSSSIATIENCASCAPGSVGSSATSGARSPTRPGSR